MDRLTWEDMYGGIYADMDGNLIQDYDAATVLTGRVVDRLAAYEQTGLSPEEIMDSKLLNGWIPVEERMPKESGNYWVTMRHLDRTTSVEKYTWKPECFHAQAWKEVVVAWQPYYHPGPFVLQKEDLED